MAVDRAAGGTSLIDVLDRVLDKGIVIDPWARVSVIGIDLITVEARVVVVASTDTCINSPEMAGAAGAVWCPGVAAARSYDALVAENAALRAQIDELAGARRRPRA